MTDEIYDLELAIRSARTVSEFEAVDRELGRLHTAYLESGFNPEDVHVAVADMDSLIIRKMALMGLSFPEERGEV